MTDGYPIFHCIHDIDLPRDNRGNRRYSREGDVAAVVEYRRDGSVQVLIDTYTLRYSEGGSANHTYNTEYVVLEKNVFEEFFIPRREYHKRWLNSLFDE
jgi:hypothetical protein